MYEIYVGIFAEVEHTCYYEDVCDYLEHEIAIAKEYGSPFSDNMVLFQ